MAKRYQMTLGSWNEKKEMYKFKSAFCVHRYDAKRRGIPFLLKFEEWMSVWLNSGFWSKRGPGSNQYVMSRPGDQGPYAINNVRIILSDDNKRENLKSAEFLRNLGKSWRGKVSPRLGKSASSEAKSNMVSAQRKRREDELIKGLKSHKKDNLPRGVYKYRGNRFTSSADINGKYIYLGIFNTAEEAHQAWLAAKAQCQSTNGE